MKNITNDCVEWTKDFLRSHEIEHVVIGISGGKDSSICAAICAEAIGNENIYGVMLPNGRQKDIFDSIRIIKNLKIKSKKINISSIYKNILRKIETPSKRTKINLAPRLRSVVLYAIAQSLEKSFVCNTSNLDERLVGYSTIWGDSIGDFSPLGNLHVSEVIQIGKDLKIPQDLIDKAPADGLTDLTDYENLGFSYSDVEDLFLKIKKNGFQIFENWASILRQPLKIDLTEKEIEIIRLHDSNLFKIKMIQIPTFVPDFRFER